MSDGPTKRVHDALVIAYQFAGVDGTHHKDYAIDQMVRALCGGGQMGNPTDEYRLWVADWCRGEDGPQTYEWNEGTAP